MTTADAHNGVKKSAWSIYFYSACFLLAILPMALSESRDYCQSEYFNGTCARGEVIYIKMAQYGRMAKGRCITGKYGLDSLGCAVDVIHYMDRKCSGTRQCKVYIAEASLHKLDTCPKELSSYLQADYICLPVATASTHECLRKRKLEVAESSLGYLSSMETVEAAGIGTSMCPWVIRSRPGQKVKLSLLSFGGGKISDDASSGLRADGYHQSGICYEVGRIVEAGRSEIIKDCGDTRETFLYESTSNEVKVELLSKEVLKTLTPFLVKYEAIGCPSLTAPPGGVVTVKADVATVECNSTGETWFLTCTGSKWHGQTGSCANAKTGGGWHLGQSFKTDQDFPYGILIVVSIGVALGVFFGGLILSMVAFYMKRKQRRYQEAVPTPSHADLVEDPYNDLTMKMTYTKPPTGGASSDKSAFASEHGHVSNLENAGYGTGTGHGGDYGAKGLHPHPDDVVFHSFALGGQRSGHFYESPQFS